MKARVSGCIVLTLFLLGATGARATAQAVYADPLYVETRPSPPMDPASGAGGAENGVRVIREEDPPRAARQAAKEPGVSLRPPTCEQLFRIQSEAALLADIRADARRHGYSAAFPTAAEPLKASSAFPPRPIAPTEAHPVVAPVCHLPLYFENRNAERYLWQIPCVQPALSAGFFYGNVLALPYHMIQQPPCSVQCNTGLPLPGDPVPYMLPAYPGKP